MSFALRFSCFLLALVAGCTSDGGFDLRVDLRTDYRPVYRFQSVRVRILEAPTDEDVRRSAESPASTGADYLTGVRVGSFSSLPEGRYLLDVALLNGGTAIATREIEIVLDQNTTVNAVMTASCEGLTCPGTADSKEAAVRFKVELADVADDGSGRLVVLLHQVREHVHEVRSRAHRVLQYHQLELPRGAFEDRRIGEPSS